MKIIEGECGQHVSKVAAACVRAARDGGEPVEMKFNDIIVPVRPGMASGNVVAEYHRIVDERHRERVASPEYKRAQSEREEKERRNAAEREAALKTAPTSMELRDPDGWAKAVEVNGDGYGSAVIRYADRWARLMEGAMAGGAKMADCAERASRLADSEGITGFMYGCAVSVLANVWAHGEELRRWHNLATQIGTEGEKANESGGVLNPALMSVGEG